MSGEARVAVVPMEKCFKNLVRDNRLDIVIPEIGSPLNWTILVCPSKKIKELNMSWIKKFWTLPMLGRLLARGWMAPLPYSELSKALEYVPPSYHHLALPPEKTWNACWTLPYLSSTQKDDFKQLWNSSIP